MGAGESIILHAGVDDALHRRERLDVAFEIDRAHRLPRQTNVGDGDLIALAIAAGRWRAGQVRLERGQRRLVPVMPPFQDAGLVDLVFMREIFAHPRDDQRMLVEGNELASPRTRARAFGSFGNSGGCGWVSSRYSMMASDSNSIVPSFSISAGNAIIGLTLRKASSRCLPFMRSMSITSSGMMPLRLSAMRTRNVANERQNENSFTAPPFAKIVKELFLPYYPLTKNSRRLAAATGERK